MGALLPYHQLTLHGFHSSQQSRSHIVYSHCACTVAQPEPANIRQDILISLTPHTLVVFTMILLVCKATRHHDKVGTATDAHDCR